MNATENAGATKLRVIDALDHPHGHRILRARIVEGSAPSARKLKGATLRASGPEGQSANLRVVGFPVFGGRPSDELIEVSGRVDLVVEGDGDAAVDRTWELSFT